MTPPTDVIADVIARERRRVATDLFVLTKPRVVLMVLVTTLVGYYIGSSGAGGCGRWALPPSPSWWLRVSWGASGSCW